ncbi:MAG TPA: hypothetical protein VH540_07720 [Ktedonobacterales bacterium]
MMTTLTQTTRHAPRRLLPAAVTLALAFLAAFVGSLDVYMIEDDSALGRAAHASNAALSLTYEAVYVTALAALVVVTAGVIRLVLARLGRGEAVDLRFFVPVLAAFETLGAFWGLVIKHPVGFLVVVGSFALLIAGALLVGPPLARWLGRGSQERVFALGPAVGAVLALGVNVAALIAHMLLLTSYSRALYDESVDHVTIGGSTLVFSEFLLFNTLALLLMLLAAVMVLRALRAREGA